MSERKNYSPDFNANGPVFRRHESTCSHRSEWMVADHLSTRDGLDVIKLPSRIKRSVPTPTNSNPSSRTVSASEVRVIDGDTVAIRDQRANVRLVGFNAPETASPACSAEL